MKMEDLIPIINQLQSVFKKTGLAEIKLPQIVVVGAQSSGKSSVLESLVKKSFLPRGTGIVTRCPIILQLNQVKNPECRSTNSTDSDNLNEEILIASPPPAEEWCRFSKNPEKIYTDFDEVRKAIEDLQLWMVLDKKGISTEPIILEVFSPNVINLTVVDLPGIVKLALEGQPADIEEQVYNLIRSYIKNESAIILAVSPANADIATSESIKLAKEVDPEGDRTIAVVTKLDLMDKGTDATNVLNGDVIKVKLGIVGVINRSQQDINNKTTMTEVRRKEDAILKKSYPQFYAIQGIGSKYLGTRLNHLLKEHIHKNLPALFARIKTLEDKYNAELQDLGPESPTHPTKCCWLICNTTVNFVTKFQQMVHFDHLRSVSVDDGSDLFSLGVNEAFERLRERIVIDLDDTETHHIKKCLQNTLNFEGFSPIEPIFKGIVNRIILKMEEPAVACAQEVYDLLILTASKCFDDHRLIYLNNTIQGVVNDLLSKHLKEAKKGIKEYVQIQAGMIVSSDPGFLQCLIDGPGDNDMCHCHCDAGDAMSQMPREMGLVKANCNPSFPIRTLHTAVNPNDLRIFHVQQLIFKYLSAARREFSDYVPKYLMFNFALKTIENILQAVETATFGRETVLVAEEEERRTKRKNKQQLLNNLCDAAKILQGLNFERQFGLRMDN